MDIGCNTGEFTSEVARSLLPREIIGIDTVASLIDRAEDSIKQIKKSDSIHSSKLVPRVIAAMKPSKHEKFPENIHFLCRDIFDLTIESQFDVIFCMSVTKWIHLSGGDTKLVDLFIHIYNLLNLNGIFVLEYQSWKSYKNKRKSSLNAEYNFKNIKIYPDRFEYVLEHLIGYEIINRFGPSVEEAHGFQRPILILKKKLITDRKTLDASYILKHFITVAEVDGSNSKRKDFSSDAAEDNNNNNNNVKNEEIANSNVHSLEDLVVEGSDNKLKLKKTKKKKKKIDISTSSTDINVSYDNDGSSIKKDNDDTDIKNDVSKNDSKESKKVRKKHKIRSEDVSLVQGPNNVIENGTKEVSEIVDISSSQIKTKKKKRLIDNIERTDFVQLADSSITCDEWKKKKKKRSQEVADESDAV